MFDDEYKFTSGTATLSGGETYELKDTHFYCLKEEELHNMADHLFEQAYKRLEKTLFFATMVGIFVGMLIMSIIK